MGRANREKGLERFAALTWDDLNAWAGRTIVKRGQNYQRDGLVQELVLCSDGGLVAWVRGSETYATRVAFDAEGELVCNCTCPFSGNCKHGVAVVFEGLAHIENQRTIASAAADDERLATLERHRAEEELLASNPVAPSDLRERVAAVLVGKSAAELVEYIQELAIRYPDLAREFSDRAAVMGGDTRVLVARLRRDIKEFDGGHGWRGHLDDDDDVVDRNDLCNRLETLLQSGQADAVLELGKDLIQAGNRLAESGCHADISSCLSVVALALPSSSLPASDQLIWAIDAILDDEYGFCEVFRSLLGPGYPTTVWEEVALRLRQRLDNAAPPSGDDWSGRSHRNRLADLAILALEHAGQADAIIPLCVAEAERAGNYGRLGQRLINADRLEDAAHWIQAGIQAKALKGEGRTGRLRDLLYQVRAQQKDWPTVLVMRVEDFVADPSLTCYVACQEAADRVGAWEGLRPCLLQHLETGDWPWKQPGWPLPEQAWETPTGVRRKKIHSIRELIKIAIHEKRPADVLVWYDRRPKELFGGFRSDETRIAAVIADHAPERSVSIWQQLAEGCIVRVNPAAYEEAAGYLLMASRVMTRIKRQAEWEGYLKQLRATHWRKRRLLEILDGLNGRRIVGKRR